MAAREVQALLDPFLEKRSTYDSDANLNSRPKNMLDSAKALRIPFEKVSRAAFRASFLGPCIFQQ